MIKNNILASIKHNTTPPTPMIAGIYHDAVNGLISLSSDGINRTTIADKNLGAINVYNDGDTLSQDNCGCYYQRGNNYGFAWTGTINTSSTPVDTTGYGEGNYYSSDTFIFGGDWSTFTNNELWNGQGPCPAGFHVPNRNEYVSIANLMSSIGIDITNGECFRIYLKMPYAGFRFSNTSATGSQGATGEYRTTTPYGSSNPKTWIALLYLKSAQNPISSNGYERALGICVRAFKDTPVVPDDTRTVLYQPSNDVR